MARALVIATLSMAAVLPGCLVWHSDTERDRPVVSRTSRSCGTQVCAADQDCVTTVDGQYHCR